MEGMFISFDTHVWLEENPHATRILIPRSGFQEIQDRDHLVGPYLLPQRLTNTKYPFFLQQELLQLLELHTYPLL